MFKKIISCLYIKDGKAVKDKNNDEPISLDPVSFAKYFSDNGADEIIVFDLSKDDAEHETSIGIIKEIARVIEVPLIAGGNIKRVEDVKKLLYAGATKAMLNFSKESNVVLTKEVSKRFGKEKIAVCLDSKRQLTQNKELIEEYIDTIVTIHDLEMEEIVRDTKTPLIPLMDTIDLGKIIKALYHENVVGVGATLLNQQETDLIRVKSACKLAEIPVDLFESEMKWDDFKKNPEGMIPVIVQDYKTNEVLMLAYMNEEAFRKTIETGKMTYFSRSRNELWVKGLTSGHFQYVKSLTMDCDSDTMLAKVSQIGAACHTGSRTCFFKKVVEKEYNETNPLKVFEEVYQVIQDRKQNPKEGSYTNYLFEKGIDKILKKVGEEATEIIIAAKNPDAEEIKYEMSDFLYHAMVLMVEKGVTWEDITKELANR
ncbi:bifunctional phosphoribosyl-AMP cyclohydrolase/phosphoribosyl-ATP diphosphatase HisIE [Candidatus Galacturonibacter soehngenii]|uniref:Histidine biosynthesis bifunctional protein HisIE n=1 Tax=Candidatus Galacturonatibacter soehngenii TaxID=2307010 RepID=A0A7V7UH21_9FIRM|nr:bifunctional phosphoribosyl-AMP cyclohydrolase/phosphoribosyl-ATP diphosphatase HisIE [Candidatus Galacturonibacter soehngenii]KAB1439558.1 bifunctional phosphoribosyl-AMP cyclohydrolase/phosphoribosyl-ATP diphosphatase HisIE [Candidatus Galacturonibacter soehngenii]